MTSNQNPFGLWSNPVLATALVALWVALLLLFHVRPGLDLAVSGSFFDAALCTATHDGTHCTGFAIANAAFPRLVRQALYHLPTAIGIALVIWLVRDWRCGRRWRDPAIHVKAVVILALVVGPGLIVNGILKQVWGRPRPWMTEQFGGWMPFVAAGTIEGMCAANCSFVSGEGAAGGWLICLVVLFPPRQRTAAFIALLAVGGTMALLRVAFGAHYLSDVILGFVSSLIVMAGLAALVQASIGSVNKPRL